MSEQRIRQLAAAAVLLVAAIAAVVSYLHIETLALTHRQPLPAARLEPLSVDGLVAAAGLQMQLARLGGQKPTGLQRVMLWAGVAATLAANVAYGWPGGLLAAAMSGWPALAFIGAAEMAIQSLPAAAAAGAPAAASRRPRPAPAGRAAGAPRGRPARYGGETARRSADATRELVAAAVAARPDIDHRGLAAELGVAARTARRYLTEHHRGQAGRDAAAA